MKIIFQTYNLKHPNKTFLVRKLLFFVFYCLVLFCFAQFFAFRQILGCWFQISQSFSIFSLKIPKRIFLVSNLRSFIFARNFYKISTQNYTNKASLVPKMILFVLHDLPFHKSEGTDTKYKNFLISRKELFLFWSQI